MKKLSLLLILTFVVSSLTSCYWQQEVKSYQVGLKMSNGVKVDEIVAAGRYTNMDYYARMQIIDISTKTTTWEDVDLWTKDKQSITFSVAVTYVRDKTTVSEMWSNYNLETTDDKALDILVKARIPRVAKQVTTSMTLDQMLGIDDNSEKNREYLQKEMFRLLAEELKECNVILIDIGVNDIGVDETYAAKLKEKATSQVELELSAQKTKQYQEQIKQEEAKTLVDLEIAKRENLVAEEKNKIFAESPEAYEIKKLELLRGILKETDKVYFVPQGADLSLYITGENASTPIINNQK